MFTPRCEGETDAIRDRVPPKESGQSAEAIAQTVQRAEDCGFNEAWVGDSQGIWHDLYVSITLWAVRTRRIRLGVGVTNLITRHPAVTARAMATLDEVSGGRALLGFGAGDTALKHLGLKPSSLKDMEEGILLIRGLLAGEDGQYQGNTIPRFTGFQPRKVPIYLACYGPKMLELAGRVTDGVNVPTGISPELIQYALGRIESGRPAPPITGKPRIRIRRASKNSPAAGMRRSMFPAWSSRAEGGSPLYMRRRTSAASTSKAK